LRILSFRANLLDLKTSEFVSMVSESEFTASFLKGYVGAAVCTFLIDYLVTTMVLDYFISSG